MRVSDISGENGASQYAILFVAADAQGKVDFESTLSIDLTDKEAGHLYVLLSDYVAKATKYEAPKAARKVAEKVHVNASLETVRAWARSNGIKVSDKGRISRETMVEFAKWEAKQSNTQRDIDLASKAKAKAK